MMTHDTHVMYDLLLKPLRFDPGLTESVIVGLKWTLGAMFEDPFSVRDVTVAVREVVDNVLTHADWNQTPAPSLSVQYRVHKGLPQVCISSTSVSKDIDGATRALRFVNEYMSNTSSQVAYRELTADFIESATIATSGGMGLLQLASSPRCHVDVRLEGALFHTRVTVDVRELKIAPAV